MAQARRTVPVDVRRWREGKARSIQRAWEAPARVMTREMAWGEKERPPRAMGV